MKENIQAFAETDGDDSKRKMILDWGSDTVDVWGSILVTGVEKTIDEHTLILDNRWSRMMANARLKG